MYACAETDSALEGEQRCFSGELYTLSNSAQVASIPDFFIWAQATTIHRLKTPVTGSVIYRDVLV